MPFSIHQLDFVAVPFPPPSLGFAQRADQTAAIAAKRGDERRAGFGAPNLLVSSEALYLCTDKAISCCVFGLVNKASCTGPQGVIFWL